ncbi:MAG TPA: hypothetical protein VGL59_09350 [Polyangia bacterium]|jgi:hypothetical protein
MASCVLSRGWVRFALLFLPIICAPLGCAKIKSEGGSDGGGGGGNGGTGAMTGAMSGTGGMTTGPVIDGLVGITVTPATQMVTMAPGGSALAMFTASGKFKDGSSRDITSQVFWSSPAPSAVITVDTMGAANVRGAGTFDVVATANNLTGMGTLTAQVTGALMNPGFPAGDQAMLDGPSTSGPADIKYPADGALFPSNWGALTVHISKTNQQSARIAISGDNVDIKYYGSCEPGPNDGTACYVSLPSDFTATLSSASATSDLSMTARLYAQGGTVTEGAPIKVAWTTVALTGGLYYWTTHPDTSTAIARYNFAGDTSMPEEVYTQMDEAKPAVTGDRCFGCHAISPDGTKLALTMGGSYPSSFQIIDLMNKAVPFTFQAPPIDMGYATETAFNNDGSIILNMYRGKFLLRTVADPPVNIGEALTSVTEAKSDPFWSPSGKLFTFVSFDFAALTAASLGPPGEVNRKNGDLKTGAQILIADSDGKTITDPPRVLVPRKAGFTSYYPSISDDDALVAFNQSDCKGLSKGAPYGQDPCDGYDDISATLNVISAKGGTPISLARASGAANGDNSWPRWSPDHGTFRGKRLYWLAFSSRRPYGLQFNPMTTDVQGSINNSHPQLWFAAVYAPDDNPQGDPSFAAIWLPGQNPMQMDPRANQPNGNHVPVWVKKVVVVIK